MIIEIIHDQLAQIIGCWLRVKMVKQLLEALDMSIIPAMDDMLPDITWNVLYPASPHEARTIGTQCVFSIIDVNKRIREPAWVESGKQASVDGYLANPVYAYQTSIDPPECRVLRLSGPALTQRFEIRWKSRTRSLRTSPKSCTTCTRHVDESRQFERLEVERK